MMTSRSTHVADIISFFLVAKKYSILYMYHIFFFIHLLVNIHVLAIVNTGVHVSFETMFSSGYAHICPGAALLYPMVALFLAF